jgi:hypothetical protein
MTRHIALYTAVFLLLTIQSHGQDPDPVDEPSVLAGLTGVHIYIEPVPSEMVEKGITDEVLLAPVELRLLEAGIPVITPSSEGGLPPGTPTLYLQVTAFAGDITEDCVYVIRLELMQEVRLARDDQTPVFHAATWGVGGIGFGESKWRNAMIEDVASFTDRFVEEYVAANPGNEETAE